MRAYISGPMRGKPRYNFDAFHSAEQWLLGQGFQTHNPARIDEALGFDPDADSFADDDMLDAIRRDVDAVLWCDVIVLLPGWGHSIGACAEVAIAKWAGKDILHLETDSEGDWAWMPY